MIALMYIILCPTGGAIVGGDIGFRLVLKMLVNLKGVNVLRGIRGRGGGMDEIEQDKSPLASHCHRPERACTRGGVLKPFNKWKQGLWMGESRNDLSFSRQCRQVLKPPARRGWPPNKNKKPAVMPTSQDTAPDVTLYAPKPTNNWPQYQRNSRSLTCDMKNWPQYQRNRQLLIISVGSMSKEQKSTQNYPVLG